MKKSDDSWSGKPRKITDLERGDHHLLRADDDCYFVGEYTAGGKGYGHSATNQLIANLKKKPSTRGTGQWYYKGEAIRDTASALASAIKPTAYGDIAFVPIPPSKMHNDPEYDDRMIQVARSISRHADVRELIRLAIARDPAHETVNTRDPELLKAKLRIDTKLLNALPEYIFLLDDLLTTGCSFRACKDLILDYSPGHKIVGMFAARRVINRDFSDFDIEDL